MSAKLLSWIAIGLCVFAILADFTSKLMSIMVDGVTLSIVIAIIYKLTKTED
tara:strand:- start:19 stop:174 length:156 start_codon:yes stop_codon:yes gene_type:complete